MLTAVILSFIGIPLALTGIVFLNYEYLKQVHNKRMIDSLKKLLINDKSLENKKIQEYTNECVKLLI